MVYKKYKELTIIKIEDITESITFETLAKVIAAKPSNVIYCERSGKLAGMISMGDIARAHDMDLDTVSINKQFTYISPDEYMKAKHVFRKRKNVNALPVMRGGVLLGDYSRWDDLLYVNHVLDQEWSRNIVLWHKNSRVVLVRPCCAFDDKQKLFQRFYRCLSLQGVIVKIIDHAEIPHYTFWADWILFVDQDEARGIDTLYSFIWDKKIARKKFRTYQDFIKEVDYEMLRGYLGVLRSEGVHVLNLLYSEDECGLKQKIADKYAVHGKKTGDALSEEMYQDFFDDLYTREYAEQILHIHYSVETKSGTGKLKDHNSKYYRVINGERYTKGQPSKPIQNIYFFGVCFIYGHYVEDKYTIESLLQKRLNESGNDRVRVVNCGSPSYGIHISTELARIMDTSFRKGDMVVLYVNNRNLKGTEKLDLMEILEKCEKSSMWLIDGPRHCNHKINDLYAKAVYGKLKPYLGGTVHETGKVPGKDTDFVQMIYIDRYFKDFEVSLYSKIGAIVMNCNPFTYGHRYLIKRALETVDFLIIFVVEEDKSVFSFAERFAMVCDGVADLEKVRVVPSGPFVLSQTTFPEYFIKEKDDEIAENAENDIMFFAEKIAPHLNIRYRFVGEEPDDLVTNEYNLAMKKILPQKGIKLIEIPRKESCGQCISASLVRKYLEDNAAGQLGLLVPESTQKVIFKERPDI